MANFGGYCCAFCFEKHDEIKIRLITNSLRATTGEQAKVKIKKYTYDSQKC